MSTAAAARTVSQRSWPRGVSRSSRGRREIPLTLGRSPGSPLGRTSCSSQSSTSEGCAAWQFLIGGALLASAALILEGLPVMKWSPRLVITLLYLSVVGTAASNVAWIAETREARLDQLTTWTLLVPVFCRGLARDAMARRVLN
ncbi:EamA family transporter [Agromyces bauzanensis]